MRRPFRACLSLLLVLTLLGMPFSRTALAMPMHHGMGQMAHHVSLDHAAPHGDRHGQCQYDAHCGLCGACHSSLPMAMISGFTGAGIALGELRPSNLPNILLPPDPRPPRA